MKKFRLVANVLLVGVLTGCATLPSGPSVNVLPARGKSFEAFRTEDATCRQWAAQQAGLPAQATYENGVATGAVAGTAVGTGLGAALGAASGHAGAGALIGAASGLAVGSAIGSNAGTASGRETQRRYDNAYVQCMYSYGNQVPGYREAAVTPPPQALPPADDYPAPPEVALEEAPRFIWSPSLGMYVAVGVPYDLVYAGDAYFYFYGGRWYRGAYYNGPWTFVPRRSYPSFLLRYRISSIRSYRDAEFRRYERDREHYEGRFHRPEFHGQRRRPGRWGG